MTGPRPAGWLTTLQRYGANSIADEMGEPKKRKKGKRKRYMTAKQYAARVTLAKTLKQGAMLTPDQVRKLTGGDR